MADWHPEDIKAAVRRRGVSLAGVGRSAGIKGASLRMALTLPRADAEAAIAKFLGVHPKVIWPSRYEQSGERKRPQPVDNYRPITRFGNTASSEHHA